MHVKAESFNSQQSFMMISRISHSWGQRWSTGYRMVILSYNMSRYIQIQNIGRSQSFKLLQKKNRTWQWWFCAEKPLTLMGFRVQEIVCGAWTERIVSGSDSEVAQARGGLNSEGQSSRYMKSTNLYSHTHISPWWSRRPRRTLEKDRK